MNAEGPAHRATIRVRYAETDRMGHAYNSHYLTWFEIGRTEFMRASGLAYREVEDRGFQLPLIKTEVTFRLPIRYDDELIIETRVGKTRSRSITFVYRILHEDRLVAEGWTTHACTQAANGRTVQVPPWLGDKVRPKTA